MRSVLLVGALCVGAATAQDPAASGTFTDRRSGLELKLEAARAQLRRGNSEKAVETYLEIEAELAEVERETPTARPVTQVGPGLDRGLRAYLRELLAELPPEAQDRYRLTTDPKASLALKQALEQDDLDALEALAARYPLSDASLSALSTLGERAFELGDLSRAARAFEALAARSSDPSTARRASWCALLAWATLGEREAAARALAAYVAHGGDPARERAVGSRSVSPRAWVESLTPRRGPDALPARFPLGDLDRDTELADPELPRALALRLDALPVYREPVYAPEDDALYLADWKRVARVPAGARGGASWAFAYP
ncbi:MAG: hypothetical protein R3F62_27825, partial [Planctomycetota bacterium]